MGGGGVAGLKLRPADLVGRALAGAWPSLAIALQLIVVVGSLPLR